MDQEEEEEEEDGEEEEEDEGEPGTEEMRDEEGEGDDDDDEDDDDEDDDIDEIGRKEATVFVPAETIQVLHIILSYENSFMFRDEVKIIIINKFRMFWTQWMV